LVNAKVLPESYFEREGETEACGGLGWDAPGFSPQARGKEGAIIEMEEDDAEMKKGIAEGKKEAEGREALEEEGKEEGEGGEEDILCVLDVAYGEGAVDRISLKEGDDPALLATAFRAKHGLGTESVNILSEVIARTMKEHQEGEVEAVEAGEGGKEGVAEGGKEGVEEEEGGWTGEAEQGLGTGGHAFKEEKIGKEEEEEEIEVVETVGRGEAGEEESEEGQGGQDEETNERVALEENRTEGEGGLEREDVPTKHGKYEGSSGTGAATAVPGNAVPSPSASPSLPPSPEESSNEALFNRLKNAWMKNKSPSTPGSSPSSPFSRRARGKGHRTPASPLVRPPPTLSPFLRPLPRPARLDKLKEASPSLHPSSNGNDQGQKASQEGLAPAVAKSENSWLFLTQTQASDTFCPASPPSKPRPPTSSPPHYQLPPLRFLPPVYNEEGGSWSPAKGKQRRKKGGASHQEAFARLYAEAKLRQGRKEEALRRQCEREAEARRACMAAMVNRNREVTGQGTEGRESEDGREDICDRLYAQAKIQQERLAKAQADAQAAKAKGPGEGEETWSCPRCFHENDGTEAQCRNVLARKTPMSDLVPNAWTHYPKDTTVVYNRRLVNDEDVIRCAHARPVLFQPTNYGREQYSSVYIAPLPLSVRDRPDNVFEELFAHRRHRDEERRRLVQEGEVKAAQACSFQPRINEHSANLVEAREQEEEAQITLTEAESEGLETLEAIVAKKKEKFALIKEARRAAPYLARCAHARCVSEERCSFQPQVGVGHYYDADFHPAWMATARGAPDSPRGLADGWEKEGEKDRNNTDVFTRLAEADVEKRRLGSQARQIEVESATFQPQTTGMPAPQRDALVYGNSVCEYLYGERLSRWAKQREAEQALERQERAAREGPFANAKSRGMIRRMKESTYRAVFAALFPSNTDSSPGQDAGKEGGQEEGALVLAQASLQRIKEPRLAQVLTLVLTRTTPSTASPSPSPSPSPALPTMHFQEFSRRLDQHLRHSIPLMSDLIMHGCRPGEGLDHELTFHPRLAPKTHKMTQDRWTTRSRQEAFALLHSEAALWEARREDARKLKAERLLDGHTFQPLLLTSRPPGCKGRGRTGRYRYPVEMLLLEQEHGQMPKVGREQVKLDARARSVQAVRGHGRIAGNPRTRSTPAIRKRGIYNITLTKVDDGTCVLPGGNLRRFLQEPPREPSSVKREVYVDLYRPMTPANPKSHQSFPLLEHRPLPSEHRTLRPRKEAWYAAVRRQEAWQRQGGSRDASASRKQS
jgi:hypothetical protein